MNRIPLWTAGAILFFWTSPLAGQASRLPDGLLLSGGRPIQGFFRLQDEQGGIWGINLQCGFIQESTHNAYGSGMYLHVMGNNFYAPNDQGLQSAAGDEVQIGPWNQMNLVVYRRIKIFRKEGLARWLEILHNPGPARKVSVLLRTHMNFGIASWRTNSGQTTFGEKDFAFLTLPPNASVPATLHIVCGPGGKVRPRVQQMGNRYDVSFDLDLPAGGTAVLVGLEAQRSSSDKLVSLMKTFRPHRYLRDLPTAAKQWIVNMSAAGEPEDLDLDRRDRHDRVVSLDGQEFLGTITPADIRLATAWGERTLPARQVVGMIAWGEEPGLRRALLTDGQIVVGTVGDQTLRIDIPSVGEQTVPLRDIRLWSYRPSPDRPEEIAFAGPYLRLRTGDRLAFEAGSVEFRLLTRDGEVKLDPAAVLQIRLEERGNLHRVWFRNESELSGLLLPATLAPTLRLGGRREIGREEITRVTYAPEEQADGGNVPTLRLADGDVLRGQFDRPNIALKGKYGVLSLQPTNIRTLRAIPDRTGWFHATLWNGSTVLGRLEEERLPFRLLPGPTMEVSTARIASFDQPEALPPADVILGITELIVQLGAESYRDRQNAQDKLIQMGPSIVPILQNHVNHKDPEIRRRLRDIINELTAVG